MDLDATCPQGLNTWVGLFLSMEFSNTNAIGTKLPICLQRGHGFPSIDWRYNNKYLLKILNRNIR